MIYFLIYTSRPIGEMKKGTLESIAEWSDKKNQKEGITGMLLGVKGRYLQYIESDSEKAVDNLFERIKRDERHEVVTLLLKGTIEKRIFNEWNMGGWFMTSEELEKIPGVHELQGFLEKADHNETDPATFLQFMDEVVQQMRMKNQSQ